MNKKISVIVPIYNELKNIEQFMVRLSDALATTDILYEIIFVDDHSTDGTFEYLERFRKSKKIILHKKIGKKGKAFSLIEGFELASGNIIVMIDSDLQYPPEEIPPMVGLLDKADIVAASRKEYKGPLIRRVVSKGFRLIFGKFLFGLNHDIQAGLKVFTKEVMDTVKVSPKSGWTFDLEFLHKASEAGFVIVNHSISFAYRKNGNSKVGLVRTTWEIGTQALSLKLQIMQPQYIPPKVPVSMIGAGIGHKKKKYITHTTLPHNMSALRTLHSSQKLFIGLLLITFSIGFLNEPLTTAIVLVAILSFIYFIDVLFNLYIILKSLHFPQEITSSSAEIDAIESDKLPVYSILCPLYKEAHVIPQFLEAISKLDWPKSKLDVMLLLEEDDKETIDVVSNMSLPSFVRKVVVPHSMPKTKPKACNYGLALAKGEYIVIYDAEDIPDPLQLKKAYLAFQKADKNVICLQAKLNYYNPNHNLLTRFFTAEYSLWFDVSLTGLQSINTSIPLGGTSNHFKTNDLKKLQGWDPFNVTEDADLGIRLFKVGYKTAMIDSTTLEEANSNLKNWMRQRSRWLKGYIQTYFVHMRDVLAFSSKKGIHALIFQLVIGGKIAFILINPFLWLATFSYFTLYAYVGPTIESLYPTVVFYMAVFSLVFGNFLFLYYYMIGCLKREHYSLIKYVFFVPIYWLMISIACAIAVYQLIFKPHYWEKTIHGFHLQQSRLTRQRTNEALSGIAVRTLEQDQLAVFPSPFRQRLAKLINLKKAYIGGASLIAASVVANFLNFLFNAYLGRVLDLANFGLVSLISSFLYFTQIPYGALGSTVNFRSGFLEGRFGSESSSLFWGWIRKRSFLLSLIVLGVWVAITPFLMHFFAANSILPFLIFAPVWVFGVIAAVDRGFLAGKLLFGYLAVVALIEPVAKLLTTYIFVEFEMLHFAYAAIPIAIFLSFVTSAVFATLGKRKSQEEEREVRVFPKKYFVSSLLAGLSTITFLSLDIILAKHYLTPVDAGRYALVSLVGKMIFFLGSLAAQFVTPLVSRSEGAMKSSKETFFKIVMSTYLLTLLGFIAFGIFGYLTVPILFGERANSIIPYLPLFAFAMLLFTVAKVFVSYYQAKKIYSFSILTFFLAVVQVVLISINHKDILALVLAMVITGGLNFIAMVLLHLKVDWVRNFERNINDLFSLIFEKAEVQIQTADNLRILIFNWRDTKHVWAGGAESYIHEIAKRWVKGGHKVTVFCGNDSHSPRNQSIDRVQIVRRGGKYMVYLWAFLYYILRFRGKFDVIVDCENGIPFFTPLYSRIPVFLLIHHVHQEVFREHLAFPLSSVARFLEGKLMPLVYKSNTVITISESSKKEIIEYGLSKDGNVEVIHPGIEENIFYKSRKTKNPSFIYLGRLKPYKNIDIAIRAFAKVVKLYPESELSIVGEGETMEKLQKLSRFLKIQNKVTFYGKIEDSDKAILLSKAWVALQPSQLEGWGITVIESNASATPVIASNVQGLRDSVVHGQTGILVEPKNADAFSKAMADVITDETYRNFLSKSAYLWSQNFSWDKSADHFYDVLASGLRKSYLYKAIGKIALAKK